VPWPDYLTATEGEKSSTTRWLEKSAVVVRHLRGLNGTEPWSVPNCFPNCFAVWPDCLRSLDLVLNELVANVIPCLTAASGVPILSLDESLHARCVP
jgi:hypothetical protein